MHRAVTRDVILYRTLHGREEGETAPRDTGGTGSPRRNEQETDMTVTRPLATAFAALLAGSLALTAGGAAFAKADGPAFDPAEGERLAGVIGTKTVLMMANHGVVTYCQDLTGAYMKMETVEHFAKIGSGLQTAIASYNSAVGAIWPISRDTRRAIQAISSRSSPGVAYPVTEVTARRSTALGAVPAPASASRCWSSAKAEKILAMRADGKKYSDIMLNPK